MNENSNELKKQDKGDASDFEHIVMWALNLGLATGHADTEQDLLAEVGWQILELQRDVRRYKYLRDNQVWHKYGKLEDDDSYALIGCKFPYTANFEAKPMLDFNIDKMLENK